MPEHAIRFDRFTYTPPGRQEPALREVSLAIEPGEFVLVCGTSGSGKSTLLKAIAGIVPHHHGGSAAGEASIAGRDLREHDAASLAAVCGTVLQDPESQAVMGGVEAEIGFPLENAGWDPHRVALCVEQTALALGIGHLLERRTAELSGGELQRVVLAASLALSPEIVVLDEPTSQLDPVAADELVALLLRLGRDQGRTVVVADHRIERLLEHADRVVALEAGAIAFDGPPRAMLEWAGGTSRDHLLPQIERVFAALGEQRPPLGMRAARRALGDRRVLVAGEASASQHNGRSAAPRAKRKLPIVSARRVTYAYDSRDGNVLHDLDFALHAGERVALVGANGSGKSSLLRLLKGLDEPGGGSVERSGAVELLLQNPNDYLLHERVADEAPGAALERFDLGSLAEQDPRDLSGGERQRLALAIVMQSSPAALLLDEPSRGMDRVHRDRLLAEMRAIAGGGTAVVLATHDVELAAEFAERVVLLGRGRVLADGAPRELLSGGEHFSTDVARLLPDSGALTVADAVALLAPGQTLAQTPAQSLAQTPAQSEPNAADRPRLEVTA